MGIGDMLAEATQHDPPAKKSRNRPQPNKKSKLPDQSELSYHGPGAAASTPRRRPTHYGELSGRALDEMLAKAKSKAYVFQSSWVSAPPPNKEEVRTALHRAATTARNPSPFRFLNDAEIAAINHWAARGKLAGDSEILRPMIVGREPSSLLLRDFLRVSYHRTQGGFTICTLSFRYEHPTRGASHEIRTGASRRSFKDAYNPIKGEMLALFRAVKAQAVTLP